MKLEDLKIEAWSPFKPGGQQVGVPFPAMQVTHIPTGLTVISKSERSQKKNKDICLSMLAVGLLEIGWKDEK